MSKPLERLHFWHIKFHIQEKNDFRCNSETSLFSMSHLTCSLKRSTVFSLRALMKIQARSSQSHRLVEPAVGSIDGAHFGEHRGQ